MAQSSEELFGRRFPSLAFLLQVTPFAPHTICEEKIENLAKEVDLEGLEIVFFYGIGLGRSYEVFRPWLSASPHRLLVYLEDHLGAIDAFSRGEKIEEILSDPKVHLHYSPDFSPAEIRRLANLYPTHFLECYALEEYKRGDPEKVAELRREILRQSATACALYSESLFSHLLAENLLLNFPHLQESFLANEWEGAFSGIPAIICGAGPSLEQEIEELRRLKGKALIIAGGSAISALCNRGIEPDLAIAFDPNKEEFDRFWGGAPFMTPLLYGMRLAPEVFPLLNNPLGYVRSDTGGRLERWWEEQKGIAGKAIGPELGIEALSVTSIALSFMIALGCDPITFVGVDLAFTGKKRYVGGVAERKESKTEEKRAIERTIPWKDQTGEPTLTSVKWLLESRCIGAFAGKQTCKITNSTEGGIGFVGVPYKSLTSLSENWKESFDFAALLHLHAQNTQLSHLKNSSDELFATLHKSLSHLLGLTREALGELSLMKERIDKPEVPLKTGKLVLCELELEEELAYRLFFPVLSQVIDQMVGRFRAQEIEEQSSRAYEWEVESTLWTQLETMTQYLRDVIESKLVA